MENLKELLTRYNRVIEALKTRLVAGRFVAFSYESEPRVLAAHRGRFVKVARYVVQAANYGRFKSVIAAKESGELGNGLAGKNEIPVEECQFLYWNEKTGKLKVRLPVVRDDGGDEFFADGLPVGKAEFYSAIEGAGWKPAPKQKAQRFQSFELSKIRLIEKLGG